MITKKICLLGSFSVGKTSLIKRFVESIFNEEYHTTIGVKVDKKMLYCHDQQVQLMVWDIEGLDDFTRFRESYLRGASGYFLVIDCTRPNTLKVAQELRDNVESVLENVPFIALLNKSDLQQQRCLDMGELISLKHNGWEFMETSARTGQNVERAFHRLTEKILAGQEAQG